MTFSPPYLLAFLLALCLLAAPAGANEWSRALADPEGQSYGNRLLDALKASGGNPDDANFLQLFRSNPNLSRRAYVAMVDQSLENSQSASTAAPYLELFAKLIEQELGDPLPWRNLQGSRDLNELVSYLDTLRPPLESDRYFADRSRLSEREWTAYQPWAAKAVRALLARTLANEQVCIAELDGFESVNSAFLESWAKLGKGSFSEASQLERRSQVAFLRLASVANLGLLDQFDAGVSELLRGDVDAQRASYLMLAGFRAALLQQRLDLAQRYASIAREAVSTMSPANPVLEYAVRTAEYRLKRMQGYRPSEAEALRDFHQAWSALEDYQPWQKWTHDRAWTEGRFATRAWLEELANFPTAVKDIGPKVVRLFSAVIKDPAAKRLENELSGRAGLLYFDETLAFYSLMVAGLDQVTYVAEVSPDAVPASDRAGFAQGLQKDLGALQTLPERLGISIAAPGFPPYSVHSQGLMVELQARANYLWASSAEKIADAERAGSFIKAANLVHQSGDPEMAVRYLNLCGQGLAALGRYDDALSCWKESSRLAHSWSLARGGVDAAVLLAQEYERRKDWRNASLYAGQAVDLIARAAPAIGTRDAQARSLARITEKMTELSVKAAIETDDPTRALEAITRAQQAQSASVQMESEEVARTEAASNMRQEEQVVALAQKVKSLEEMPASATRDALLAPARTLLASSRAEFLADTRKLRQKYSEIYGRALRFDPLNLPEVQKSLPGDVAVVEYFPTDDALYIFVVTQSALRLHQVAIDRQSLSAMTSDYVRSIRRGRTDQELTKDAKALFQVLIAPAEQDIASCQTVVLIPTGRLNVLPFASLLDPSGAPLGQSKRLLSLAKPTDLTRVAIEKPRSIDTLTAFANATEDLPAAAREGDEIAALFPKARIFRGRSATREAFMEFGGASDALHLATHGEWDLDDSLANYLSMADRQKVSQEEIFGLDLDKTSLVILSACNTAMGDGSDSSGYVASLAEAFWVAGSQSVIASLWAVNDESTSLLMTEFYKSLRAGASKVEALHQAQATVRSKPQFSHPYFWSGFVLFGDWR
jgi:CHAT domain-containing protein